MRLYYWKFPQKTAFIGFLIFVCYLTYMAVLYPGQLGSLLGIFEEFDSNYPRQSITSILAEKGIKRPLAAPLIVVFKSERKLTLYAGEIAVKSYLVAMGESYLEGDKEREGDERTPEGTYYVAEKRIVLPPDSFLGSRWMLVSYPNIEDARKAFDNGILDGMEYRQIKKAAANGRLAPQKTSMGGEIGIHGGHTPGKSSHWTDGCIALLNRDIEELYEYVPVGTPIIIKP